ncbi:pentatricopeptide repeat-containing protein At5g41170, mitochondrial-like [Mangifera indica]|uniref:pentatricopeptide repeat-containing protein At5g41170, mitochondrial-like n=1 Tax=Mangifera indica TaxID=29780 RepID=UPI001CFB889A|nr:pentatricopeptide repeat-containing protein At5g41170, mitochondrial-like [Mangifera indica]
MSPASLRPRCLLSYPLHSPSLRVISLLATFLERLVSASASSHQPCCTTAILSRNLTFDSSSGFNFNTHSVEGSDLGENIDGSDKDSGDSSFFGSHYGDVEKNKKSKLDRFDEVEDSDEEVEDGEYNSDCNDTFTVLESFDKNCINREDVRRVEAEEDELRHPLVREVCRLIELRSAWSPKHEEELRHLLRSLKSQHVCAVLRSQTDERVALKFFYWADRQWRYRHDTIVYYVMLEVLSKTKLCQGAKRVLRLMIRRGINCWPEAFSYVMVSYSRAGKLRNAMQILTMMQKAGVKPDLLICNTAIHVLVVGNKLEKALRFVKRMQLVGITPNVVTYNSLIKGCCNLQCIEDALELIAEMPHKGCSPDRVSYFTVMGFLCKEKRIKEVRNLMEQMVTDGNLLHDQVTYETLIHMLSKHGHGDEALKFLKEAEDKGFQVDKVAYSAIIHSFCKDGRIQEAKELVNQMFQKGCIPDVVTYTAVVNGFCRVGKLDLARKMLQQMYKHGCKPNTVSYTALLNGLCRNGKSLEAREMINMSEEEWWTPNAITYSVVMHGLRRERKLSEACDVVREMIKRDFFPTPVEINLLIQSLCQEGKINEAKKFMEECLNKGCAVNVVNFTTVIHGFCQNDDLDAALSLLDDMYLSNKHPDAVTYTTIIDALGRKGRIEEASELSNQMLRKGLVPTAVTYRTIIHWYCQMGRVEDLLQLLEKMLSRQKCRTAYNQVIEKLCNFGNLEEADKLLSKVLRTASKVDARTCHVLMESYMSKGIPLSAYKVACRMFNRNLIPDLKLCEKVSKKLVFEGKSEEANNLMLRFVERGKIQPYNQEHLQS